MILSAAYDLEATALVNPADDEDMALTLNGMKKKIKRGGFCGCIYRSKVGCQTTGNLFAKMQNCRSKWIEEIEISFPDKDYKEKYQSLLNERFDRLLK